MRSTSSRLAGCIDLRIHSFSRFARPASASSSTISLHLCQSALLVYALDSLSVRSGDLRRTAVTKRLPTLARALRYFDFISCRHVSSEDWQAFVYREQIVRVVAWTYCADCLATLCFSTPPSFTIAEMTGDVPCDSDLWDSDRMILSEKCCLTYKSTSLAELVATLLDATQQRRETLQDITVSQVQMTICGQ